jgi:hypothetical protein
MMPVGADLTAAPVTRCRAFRIPNVAVEPAFEDFQPF